MKRPLPAVALLYVAGILLGRFLPLSPLGLFGLCFGVLALILVRASARASLLGALLVLLGWTNLCWRTTVLSPDDLRRVIGDRPALTTIIGTLCDSPSQRVLERAGRESWRSLAKVDVRAVREKTGWQPACGRVLVSTPGILGNQVFAGQTVVIRGVLQPPKSAVAEGLFDYRHYLAWQGIYHELRAESTNDWRVIIGRDRPFYDRFRAWAQTVLARGLPVEDESLRLLWAMTLGWTTALTGEVSQPFMCTGTMHIFAISGLHIALIAGMLVNVLRLVRVSRGACGLLVVPFIWFYTGATGWQPSAIRSTIMMTVIIAGWALKRPSDLLNSLAAAGLIILLWQPQQLFQASFQLSFFVVLSMALLLPPFESLLCRCLRPDPLLPPELRPRWQRWLEPPVRLLAASFATSLAAWIGSLPLIAYYFHLVTPISLAANLVIVPLSSLALMCNLASLFCGNWLPGLTVLFNHSAWFWMQSMIRLCEWAAALPFAYFYTRTPGLLAFLAYYVLALMILARAAVPPRLRPWAWSGTGALLLAAALAWHHDFTTPRLTVLAVNSADVAFFDAPRLEPDLLVNCGNDLAVDLVVKPFLRAQGLNRLDDLLLTHGNSQQISGAPRLAKELAVRKVLTSSVRFRSPVYREFIRGLQREPQRWRRLNRGDHFDGWSVEHPEARERQSLAEDQAVVLRGEFAGTRVLLLSGLGRAGQRALRAGVPDLQADLVVAGVPASGETLDEALLDTVRPQAIILCADPAGGRRRVGDQLRHRLIRRGVPVFYTSESGSVTVSFRPHRWEARAMSGESLTGTPRGTP
ncbi:MAG: ComEC/Rec2 family competence protein [Verrucomicrobia bacterium]|nr:ComEC/Rec2 family competence protein [Verrucomicrobiota bacterium]